MSEETNKKIKKLQSLEIASSLLMIVSVILMLISTVIFKNVVALCFSGLAMAICIFFSIYFGKEISKIIDSELERIKNLDTESALKEFGLNIHIQNDEKGNDIDRLLNGEEIIVDESTSNYTFNGKHIRVVLK